MLKDFFNWLGTKWYYTSERGTIERRWYYHKTNEGVHHIHSSKTNRGLCFKGRLFEPQLTAEVTLATMGDAGLIINFNIPLLIGFFITFDYRQPKIVERLMGKGYGNRTYGFYTCDIHANFSRHSDEMGMFEFRGWNYLISWERIFKGKVTYLDPVVTHTELINVDTLFNKHYETKNIQLKVATHQHETVYSRWPSFKFNRYQCDVVLGGPLVYCGKGENSWDQDDNDLDNLSIGCHCTSPREAAFLFVEHLQECRERYG